jgi:hypothetical protein
MVGQIATALASFLAEHPAFVFLEDGQLLFDLRSAKYPTTIAAWTPRLSTEDVSKVRVLAERKGLPYQTYLEMLIHEALPKEEGSVHPVDG